MKRKLIALIVVISLLFSLNVVQARTILDIKDDVANLQTKAIQRFRDVKADSWFLRNVSLLAELGIINGYEDGTYKPSNPLTKAQFIKMTVVGLGNGELSGADDYWATAFILKAQELRLIDSSVAAIPLNYDVPIKRGEMSEIIVKALGAKGESISTKYADYQNIFPDYASIPDNNKAVVLMAYTKGILAGYEDGNFKAGNTLTRAEAATVLVRMLDISERLYIDTLINQADIARLKAYPKAGDGAFEKLPDVEGVADFGEYAKVESARTEESYKLVVKFLQENQWKYKLKDTEFYTNRELIYGTKKGLVRMRGIVDGVDQEFEFGYITDGTYVILNVKELKK